MAETIISPHGLPPGSLHSLHTVCQWRTMEPLSAGYRPTALVPRDIRFILGPKLLLTLGPKLCLGPHVREAPLRRIARWQEAELAAGSVPTRSLGTSEHGNI